MKKLIFIFLILPTIALGQFVGSVGNPDPYFLNEFNLSQGGIAQPGVGANIARPSKDIGGKILRTQSINPAIKNCVAIDWGQSNWSNVAPTPFIPVNAAVIDNLNIYDGAIYNAVDPLLGTSFVFNQPPLGGHPPFRTYDALITAGKCDRFIIVPVSIDGENINEFDIGFSKDRITVALKRLAARGIICGATGVRCIMSVGIGETDCALGTSQSSFVLSFNNIIARAITNGFVGYVFINRESFVNGAPCTAIQNAETLNTPTGVINNAANIYLGADMDSLVGNVCNGVQACRQFDNLHLSDAGSIAVSTKTTVGLYDKIIASGF